MGRKHNVSVEKGSEKGPNGSLYEFHLHLDGLRCIEPVILEL